MYYLTFCCLYVITLQLYLVNFSNLEEKRTSSVRNIWRHIVNEDNQITDISSPVNSLSTYGSFVKLRRNIYKRHQKEMEEAVILAHIVANRAISKM